MTPFKFRLQFHRPHDDILHGRVPVEHAFRHKHARDKRMDSNRGFKEGPLQVGVEDCR